MKNQTIGWTLTLKIVKFQTREKQPPTPPPKNKNFKTMQNSKKRNTPTPLKKPNTSNKTTPKPTNFQKS